MTLSPRRAEAGGSSTFFKSVYLATVMDPEIVHVLPGVFPGVIYCSKILAHSLGGFSSFNVPTELLSGNMDLELRFPSSPAHQALLDFICSLPTVA